MKAETIALALAATMLFISGCGENQATEVQELPVAQEEAATIPISEVEVASKGSEKPVEIEAETKSETETEAESETESETANAELIPYAEQNAWEFRDISDFDLPYYTYLVDENGDEIERDDAKAIQSDAHFHIDEIKKTLYGDGTCSYEIHYTEDFDVLIEATGDAPVDWYIHNPFFSCIDYYSGMVTPAGNVKENDEPENWDTEILEYGDNQYEIHYVLTAEYDASSDFVYTPLDNGWEQGDKHVTCAATILMDAPGDYDGLCLCIEKKGLVSRMTSEEKETEAHLFDKNPEEYWFIRVDDYADIVQE